MGTVRLFEGVWFTLLQELDGLGQIDWREAAGPRGYPDPLRERLLKERGIELVCPHRKGRKKKPTQIRRSLRRYKKLYKVERTHSWFHNFRRLVIRYETILTRYLGCIHLACALITLRRL